MAAAFAPSLSLASACVPKYDKYGKVARSPYQVKKFRKTNPCPATGKTAGACYGYQVDHVVPLSCCGADKPSNMQWLSVEQHAEKTKLDNALCRRKR